MEKKVGEVTHYYTDISVALVKLEGRVEVGDKVKFKGHTTDFEQQIDSMEIEHEKVKVGKKGQKVGIKVKERVRDGDYMYTIN
ncbi:MAG: translation elongation factor-like protein [Candidatus Korarchaeota archaeon]|nr:translation elongation factor-like protein [Candidatus Korarchaeota archaeon]NIU84430.1 translation elongation factor-like protein [Candidatus Thorarchaeota archaeon]NIW12913.1 translation elongation factor-like protein [Candidatus Thorarchaeota archaeon]NIW51877.1 translation elongation factor-like protein [Candidatus Korarchaeota archaeon]